MLMGVIGNKEKIIYINKLTYFCHNYTQIFNWTLFNFTFLPSLYILVFYIQ